MGREVAKTVLAAEDLELVGAVDSKGAGADVGSLIDVGAVGIPIENNLAETISRVAPDVAIDFTVPQAVYSNINTYLEHNVKPVVGTSGLPPESIKEILERSAAAGVGGVVAPNFALGAVLMMRFAAEAAKHFPHVEILELHHDQKVDAPSSTAVITAEKITEQRGELQQGHPREVENIPGARGGRFSGGVRIHSVRLPGLVAHQEVIFGGLGQTLTIRHDSISRESFMPGVMLAVRKVMPLKAMVYGLDKLLFD
jgi:4-hydroxy-tetrahydrodipicolinate reductase